MILSNRRSPETADFPLDSPAGRTISSFLLGIGLLILLVSLLFSIHYVLIQDELVEVDAQVERISDRRRGASVFVSYEYDGERYEMVPYESWHPGLVEGASLTVKLRPDSPGKTVSNISIFFLLFGLIYTGFTSVIWFKCHHPPKRQSALAVSTPQQDRPRNGFDRPFGTNW